MKKQIYKYSIEELTSAVSDSESFRDVLSKLNISDAGANYKTIRKLIKLYNIDTSHFVTLKNRIKDNKILKYDIEDILSNKVKYSSNLLKKRLVQEGYFKNECQHCKQTMWFDLPIPLELHHIDHNHENNNLTNLMLLCPNCHTYQHKISQTIKKRRKYVHKQKVGRKISPVFKNRKVERPDYETLKREIAETNYCAVGRKYGVSDNAVRKWVKFYEKCLMKESNPL